jgi:hypothetical protein
VSGSVGAGPLTLAKDSLKVIMGCVEPLCAQERE